jgi:hypothetical protein
MEHVDAERIFALVAERGIWQPICATWVPPIICRQLPVLPRSAKKKVGWSSSSTLMPMIPLARWCMIWRSSVASGSCSVWRC